MKLTTWPHSLIFLQCTCFFIGIIPSVAQELASHSGSQIPGACKLRPHSAVIVVHRYRNSYFIKIAQYYPQIFLMLCHWLRGHTCAL